MHIFPRSHEREHGYALLSVLLLTVLLFILGTLVMRNISDSRSMVNISGDIVSAQADGETRLMLKLSDLRAQIMNLQNEEEPATLEDVQDIAASFVDAGSVTMDEESSSYTAVVSATGKSGKITQTLQRKIEITLNYSPTGPPDGTDNGYTIVSQGPIDINSTLVEGNIYSTSGFMITDSTISGQKVTPISQPSNGLEQPGQVDVTQIIADLNEELTDSLSDLFNRIPTYAGAVSQNQHFAESVTLRGLSLMPGIRVQVDGDLLIQGDLTMEAGSTLSSTGNIYINGSLKLHGDGEIHSGNIIRVNGAMDIKAPSPESNPPPRVIIHGDLYTSSIDLEGTLTAGRIYLNDKLESTLYGKNQFKLYTAGSTKINGGSIPSSLRGYIYSNGAVHIVGNNRLVIEGLDWKPKPPDQPGDIVFKEGNW